MVISFHGGHEYIGKLTGPEVVVADSADDISVAPDAVRNTSNTDDEGEGRDRRCAIFYPAQSDCKVHAVRLLVQSGPTA